MPSEPDSIAVILPQRVVDPHGSLRLAAHTYRAALEEEGCPTLVIDLDQFRQTDAEALCAPQVRGIFSDGGWINTVQVATAHGPKALVDLLEKPVVALINDNPCAYWMPQVIAQDRPHQTTAFLDPDFATLWSRWAVPAGRHQVYVPACPVPPRSAPEGERAIDILVAVSVRPADQFRAMVRANFRDPIFLRLFDGIVDTGLGPSGTSLAFSTLTDGVCRSLGVRLDHRSPAQRTLLYAADGFIRNQRRHRMLTALAGQPILLVGGGPEVPVHPHTRCLPAMPHADLLRLYGQARTVVVSPPYAGGLSERVIQPMAAGALVLSPPTGMSDRLLGRDRVFVTVRADFADVQTGLDRARDPVFRGQAVAGALDSVRQRFSPAAMAKQILSWIDGQSDTDQAAVR